jgi:hypothetical protein
VAGVRGRIAIMFGLSSSGAGALPDRFRALRKAPHPTNHVGGGLVPNIRTRSRVNVPLSPHQEGDAASQNQAPESRKQPWKRSREIDAAPHSAAQRAMRAPWKRSQECEPFGSDDAIVDLPNKALAPDRHSEPPAPPVGMKRRKWLRLAAIPIILATGIAGYKLGSGPQAPLPPSAPRSTQFDQSGLVSEELSPTAQVLKSAPLPSASPALLSRVSTEQPRIDATTPQRSNELAKAQQAVEGMAQAISHATQTARDGTALP